MAKVKTPPKRPPRQERVLNLYVFRCSLNKLVLATTKYVVQRILSKSHGLAVFIRSWDPRILSFDMSFQDVNNDEEHTCSPKHRMTDPLVQQSQKHNYSYLH
jgi:hypothetical protein